MTGGGGEKAAAPGTTTWGHLLPLSVRSCDMKKRIEVENGKS
jgi:hypothetical protein